MSRQPFRWWLGGLGLIGVLSGCSLLSGGSMPGPKAGVDIPGAPAKSERGVMTTNRDPIYRR